MSDLLYPASLPCPKSSTVTPAERRALSNASRPRDARALARDRLEVEKLEFPPMVPAEFATFRAWWESDLILGGAWFAADWPLPRGMITAVRKFIGAPVWSYTPGGFWRITAVCQVRGRGELPQEYVPPPPPPPPQVWDLGNFGTMVEGHAATPYIGASMYLAGGEAAWGTTGVIEEIKVDATVLTGGAWASIIGSLLYVQIRRSDNVVYNLQGSRSA